VTKILQISKTPNSRSPLIYYNESLNKNNLYNKIGSETMFFNVYCVSFFIHGTSRVEVQLKPNQEASSGNK